jgi:ferredoxin
MRAEIDVDLCQANGLCTQTAPRVFSLGDDDEMAQVDNLHLDDELAAAEEAARICPARAIRMIND